MTRLKAIFACSTSLVFYSRQFSSTMRFVAAFLALCTVWGAEEDPSAKGKKPGPPFFLIDSTDQLCLSGEEFKRCSIDTLFFVSGAPGK
jgi:hypothetical protein